MAKPGRWILEGVRLTANPSCTSGQAGGGELLPTGPSDWEVSGWSGELPLGALMTPLRAGLVGLGPRCPPPLALAPRTTSLVTATSQTAASLQPSLAPQPVWTPSPHGGGGGRVAAVVQGLTS